MTGKIKSFFQRGDRLAIGFGITVAMWTTGYLFRFPALMLPSQLLFAALLLCLFTGGVIAGVYSSNGSKCAWQAGVLSAFLNLMVMGSLLSDGPLWIMFIWLPALFIISAFIAYIGSIFGKMYSVGPDKSVNWSGAFSIVACIATFFLLIAGGLVTSHEAGLAVVDWPNSFGYNMFLYPLAHMTGGIYYEHAHRLFGSLVGLTTIFLAGHFIATENRAWLRHLGVICVVLVVVQGILGGLRVTGHFTLSTLETDVKPNIYLAVVHGVLGQIFFSILVAVAVFTSFRWQSDEKPMLSTASPTDQLITKILVGMLIVQLVLGAVLRHINNGLMMHITLATIVTMLVVFCGARAWGFYTEKPVIQRLGLTVLAITGLQFALGVVTLIAVTHAERVQQITVWDVTFATAHQANGALLLALSVMLMLWTIRLTAPPQEEAHGLIKEPG